MIFLEPITDLNTKKENDDMELFKKHIENGKQGFLFLYMDGCIPCTMTKKNWENIHKHIRPENLSNDNVMVAQINKNFYHDLKNVGDEPMGFPTFRYINHNGKIVEEYESGRNPEDFAAWIETKLPASNVNNNFTTVLHKTQHHRYPSHRKSPTPSHHRTHRLSSTSSTKHRSMRGGKWSQKYKKSINCKRPKGFSQRQYCKYGRKTQKGSKRSNKSKKINKK